MKKVYFTLSLMSFYLFIYAQSNVTIPTGTPFSGEPVYGEAMKVPGDVQAAYFDDGGQDVAYWDGSTNNEGNSLFRNGEYVDLNNYKGVGTLYQIGYFWIDEWVSYTINVTQAGKYTISINWLSGWISDVYSDISFYRDTMNDAHKISVISFPGAPNQWLDQYYSDTVITPKGGYYFSKGIHKFIIKNTGDVYYGPINFHSFSFAKALGVKENLKDISVSVYPNPATDFVNINFKDASTSLNGSTLELTDIFGKILYSKLIDGSTSEQIDVSSYSKGIYFVKVNNSKTISTKRFIKD